MNPANSRPATGRPRPTPRRIDVLRVEPLSPRMVRIRFGGPAVHDLVWRGPAAHLKLIVPEPGRHAVELPGPDAPRSPRMRTYTPRRISAETGEIDIDFVLHGDGPASQWAAGAAVGDQLVMMGPAPGYAVDAGAAWFLLIGDDSALPALETILEALPATAAAIVRIEVPDKGEVRTLAAASPRADIQWVTRGPDPRAAGASLEKAVLELADVPDGPGRIYIGCEAAAVRRIRELLRAKPWIDRARVVARGYWRLGQADHPDRDFVEESPAAG